MNMGQRLLFVKVLTAGVLLYATGAHAAEQWSTDLWTEEDEAPGGESSTSDWDWWQDDGASDGGAQQGGGSGSGLWSEELWSDPKPGTPQPAEPKPAEPEPTTPPPAGPIPDPKHTITMQIGSSKAVVRGAETELSVPPFTINGRAMIPLRFIGEALQTEVSWSDKEQKVTLEGNGKKAELWVGRNEAVWNGGRMQLDFPPMVLNGTTLVPLRFVGEFFGYQVNFESATQAITIVGAGEPKSPQPSDPPPEEPEEPQPEQPETPEVPEALAPFLGRWELRMDGLQGGMLMGRLIVDADGTYAIATAGNPVVAGTWRPAEKDEVIGQSRALILQGGPNDVDWVMIPKKDGIVSVRYQQGYTGQTKIWFEYSLGVRAAE
ncbi:copper amine oxidase N-terminal domain-containing protein [Paenibacillus sp.]|uniref:copper amine oxidase N-terminal domain-containing protein n=1 Tax=Paenibacillus sp. TaxID=58172 RepID=UPI002D7105B3|nr:copper amine oxidase N-terminal domain-containing protein [Paenibacillus sp.]HZG58597.1 copper amine oxidase N-terminal domain-containing protein [Paenibacillus sp.]